MANPVQISLSDAKFQDLAVSGINAKLMSRLAWLTTAYGVAVKKPNEKGFYPATETISNDSKEYLSLFPDKKLGTYCFWDVVDGATLEKKGDFICMTFNAGIIFWGDLRTVYSPGAWKAKNIQNVLFDVVEALRKENFRTSRLEISKSYTESLNIYKGYYSKEIETQHLMRPFFGFRIDCNIVHKQIC